MRKRMQKTEERRSEIAVFALGPGLSAFSCIYLVNSSTNQPVNYQRL